MDPTTLNIASMASGVVTENYAQYGTLEYFCNASRGNWCTVEDLPASLQALAFDWTDWEGTEYTLINNRSESTSEPSLTLTETGLGELQAPYSDQLILAYETQVAPQVALEVTYVNKSGEDLIDDTCAAIRGPGMASSRPRRPSTWTRQLQRWLIVNMPTYERLTPASSGRGAQAGAGWCRTPTRVGRLNRRSPALRVRRPVTLQHWAITIHR
jgi:hypothetical protein